MGMGHGNVVQPLPFVNAVKEKRGLDWWWNAGNAF